MNVNAPTQPFSGTIDVDEFMAFLETRPHKEHWELIEGVAVRMDPVTFAHRQIAYNLATVLNNAFAARCLDVFAYQSVAIRNPGLWNFQSQPDVVVGPGLATYDLYSEWFRLAAEILSPSNNRTEIGLKLRRYREAPDNLYAVVVAPGEFLVEVHAKRRNWEPVILNHAEDTMEMPEFGLSCRVVDLYRGTPLDPQQSGAS